MQVVSDLIISKGRLNRLKAIREGALVFDDLGQGDDEPVEIHVGNPDFDYRDQYTHPRLTLGAWFSTVQTICRHYGVEVSPVFHGKPFSPIYEFARNQLVKEAKSMGFSGVKKFYAIGDNPKSDISGSNNQGDKWHSILVRTGNFDGENDPTFPAKTVCDNVWDAIQFILSQEKK